MSGCHELNPAFSDGTGCHGFKFSPDLVDDDHLGVVIFNGFDHYLVLQGGCGNLHTASLSYRGMGYISVSAYLVGSVHNNDAFGFRQNTRGLTQHGGFPIPGFPSRRMLLPDSTRS